MIPVSSDAGGFLILHGQGCSYLTYNESNADYNDTLGEFFFAIDRQAVNWLWDTNDKVSCSQAPIC